MKKSTKRARSARKHHGKALVAVPLTGIFAMASGASAQQCDIPRTKSKSKVKLTMERAFDDCTAPDTSTEGGLPACSGFGTSTSEWATSDLKPLSTKLQLQMKSDKAGDVGVKIKGSGVGLQGDGFAQGEGTLRFTVRLIVDDPGGGPMHTAPFELTTPVTVDKGKIKGETSFNAMMGAAGVGVLPPCFRGDVLDVTLTDEIGNDFSTGGISPLFSERGAISFGTRG